MTKQKLTPYGSRNNLHPPLGAPFGRGSRCRGSKTFGVLLASLDPRIPGFQVIEVTFENPWWIPQRVAVLPWLPLCNFLVLGESSLGNLAETPSSALTLPWYDA
jgi:hypothetical protein